MSDKELGDALEKGLSGFIAGMRKDYGIADKQPIVWNGLVDAVGDRAADRILGNPPKPFTEAEIAVRMEAMKKRLEEMGL